MYSPSVYSALKKLRELFSREEKLKCLTISLFAACTSFFEVITATSIIVFAQVLNVPESGDKYLSLIGLGNIQEPGRVVFYLGIIVGVIYIVKNTVAACEVFYTNKTIQKINHKFKKKLLGLYSGVDYGFHLTRNSSMGIQVIGADVELMFTSAMAALACILSEGLVFIFLVSMIVIMNPILSIIIFVLGILLSFFITKVLLPRFYVYGAKLQESSQFGSQYLIQFFQSFKEILILGKRESFINDFDIYSKRQSEVQAMYTAVNSLPRMVIEVFFMVLFVVTIGFLCLEKDTPSEMMGILGGYLYAGFRLMPGLNRLINQLNIFKSNIPAIEQVHREYKSLSSNENYFDIPEFQFIKSIKINNIRFKYLNTSDDAIKGVSFVIERGECIGIVGETGSGKSTLVDILLGILRPYDGSILVDEKYPVNTYQWHKKIGYVPQNVGLIDATIEENIAFGEKEVDYKRLQYAIESAQLNRLIDKLPDGVNTFIGEFGVRLSGGERQRIAIARALYHLPEVLIFDEATSALDSETEERLMQTINSICANHTVIMIAHRLTTLKKCDSILVMDKGNLVKITSYNDLTQERAKVHA